MLHSISPEQAQEMLADVTYEYTVEVGTGNNIAYVRSVEDPEDLKFGPLSLADWTSDYEEAEYIVDEVKKQNPDTTACVVCRWVSAPKPAE